MPLSTDHPLAFLPKIRRNELYDAIREGGLNPSTLRVITFDPNLDKPALGAVRLIAHPHSYVFVLIKTNEEVAWGEHEYDDVSRKYIVGAYPANYDEDKMAPQECPWSEALSQVKKWSSIVDEITNTNDVWAELEHQRQLLTPMNQPSDDNTPFTQQEQSRIAATIDEILDRVRQQNVFSPEQFDAFASQLNYQKKAAGWLGRIDWLNGFTGAVLGAVVSAGATQEVATKVIHIAAAAVNWLLVHVPSLPPLLP
jgi:hypothetical protein